MQTAKTQSQDISIEWKRSLHSKELLTKYSKLSKAEINSFRKQEVIFEQFEVHYRNKTWTQFSYDIDPTRVLKSPEEIKAALDHLEKKHHHKPRNSNVPKTAQSSVVLRILGILQRNGTDISDERIVDFLQIYDLQFDKIKSFRLNKKCGGRYVDKLCCNCAWLKWKQRDFVITKHGILYHKEGNAEDSAINVEPKEKNPIQLERPERKICEYISFNKYFEIIEGIQTGYKFGVKIRSYHRTLVVSANDYSQFVKFVFYLKETLENHSHGKLANPFNSFSPTRSHNDVEFYVDGAEYFGAIADHLPQAQSQIFIAGWWISPEFHLVRPIDPKQPTKHQLRSVLEKITRERNVKVYILAYRESSLFLPNDSNYTKEILEGISPNIKVITHPANKVPWFWTHHEKIVVIDQKIAFVGGLDICYGRYDTQQHEIKDREHLYPGIQYNNTRIKEFENVRQHEKTNIMRTKHPRLPWHDVSMRLIGESVADISRHFIEYWNFAGYESLYQERIVLVPESGSQSTNPAEKVTEKIIQFAANLKNRLFDSNASKGSKGHKGSSRKNSLEEGDGATSSKPLEVIREVNHTEEFMKEEEVYRQMSKDNPMNDTRHIGSSTEKYRYVKEKLHPQSEREMHRERQKQIQLQLDRLKKAPVSTVELPGDNLVRPQAPSQSAENPESRREKVSRQIRKLFVVGKEGREQEYDSDKDGHEYLKELPQNGDYDLEKILVQHENHSLDRQGSKDSNRRSFSFDLDILKRGRQDSSQRSSTARLSYLMKVDRCQVLRSVSKWSIGCRENDKECSVHDAYVDSILNAEHFVYIENQFFLGATEGDKVLKNEIIKALITRITRAISDKKKFKVMVIMPLIPGFAGELDDPDAIVARLIMHWQLSSIRTAPNSIYNSLKSLVEDPSKYIQFYSLRNHDIVNEKPQTEIIYIHSKLMIVDDKKLIIGSANINDRSMRGTRDSEIAVLYSGGKEIDAVVDGQSRYLSMKENLYDSLKDLTTNRFSGKNKSSVNKSIQIQQQQKEEKKELLWSTNKVVEKIRSLRIKLMKEHFGSKDPLFGELDFSDMLSTRLWSKMEHIAKTNTQFYRKVFGCYPDDQIQTLKEIKLFKKTQPNLQLYGELKSKVQGHVVHYPFNFLSKENLLQGNGMYPNIVTT